jgi:hypothetical protein
MRSARSRRRWSAYLVGLLALTGCTSNGDGDLNQGTALVGGVAPAIETSGPVHPCASVTSGSSLIDEMWATGVFPRHSLLDAVAAYPDATSANGAATIHLDTIGGASWRPSTVAEDEGIARIVATRDDEPSIDIVLRAEESGWTVLGVATDNVQVAEVALVDGSLTGLIAASDGKARTVRAEVNLFSEGGGSSVGDVTLDTAVDGFFSIESSRPLLTLQVGSADGDALSVAFQAVVAESLSCSYVAVAATSDLADRDFAQILNDAGLEGVTVLRSDVADAVVQRHFASFADLEPGTAVAIGAVAGRVEGEAARSALERHAQVRAVGALESRGLGSELEGPPKIDATINVGAAPSPTACVQPPEFLVAPDLAFSPSRGLPAADSVAEAIEVLFAESQIVPVTNERLVVYAVDGEEPVVGIESANGFRQSVLRLAETNDGWRVTDWLTAAC